MRKLILAGWIGVFLTSGLTTAKIAAQQPASNEPWANKLFGGVTSHDFGTVAKGSQLKFSFRMTNIYKVPLEITSIRPECGCVTVTKSTNVIQPNETAELHINMDGRRITGPKTVKIHVTVGPQFISTATLSVSAATRQNVELNPGEIVFGVVHRGATPTQIIDVQHSGGANWRFDEIIKNSNAPFELRVEDLKGRLGAGKTGYRIFATLKADATPGEFKQEVLLKTNDPATQILTFFISGNVLAPLVATPPTWEVSVPKLGAPVDRKVSIMGSQPFRITRVDGQGQGLSAIFDPNLMATMHLVIIRCQMDQPGDLHRTLLIVSNLDNQSVPVNVDAHGER